MTQWHLIVGVTIFLSFLVHAQNKPADGMKAKKELSKEFQQNQPKKDDKEKKPDIEKKQAEEKKTDTKDQPTETKTDTASIKKKVDDIKPPVQEITTLTFPLYGKVYCTNKPFNIDDKEKPLYFQPYDNPLNKYSWFYQSVSVQKEPEICYVLVGYSNHEDALKSGRKLLVSPLATGQLALAQSGAEQKDASTKKDAEKKDVGEKKDKKEEAKTATDKKAATDETKSDKKKDAAQKIDSSQAVKKTEEKQILAAQPTMQQPDKIISKSQTTKILEIQVMCTNQHNVSLTPAIAQKYLPQGEIYGDPFDLNNNSQCVIVGTKNSEDAAKIKEAAEQTYLAVKGPEHVFD